MIEWLCMGFLWPESGVMHSQSQLDAEIRYLEQDVKASLLTDHPVRFSVDNALWLHERLFLQSGLVNALAVAQQSAAARTQQPPRRFQQLLNRAVHTAQQALVAAMIATQVYVLRLSVLVLSLPVFILAALVGAVDGIVQRDLNRWRGGRELGQRYHLAKGFVAPGLTLPWIVYLSWPTTVHPFWIVLPLAVFVGVVVAITTATFKKYF